MQRRSFLKSTGFLYSLSFKTNASQSELNENLILEKLKQAVVFYHQKVARHGGYVYRYSDDLQKSEGEGETGPGTVWVQPPGTPAVGLAMLEIYEKTGLSEALQAAIDAGHCLVQGQLHSGCWTDRIEFLPSARKKFAYLADGKAGSKAFNVSTFDDDKSQSAIRFLLHLNQKLKGSDAKIRKSLEKALQAVCDSQFPNGGFAQGFSEPADQSKPANLSASYPDQWPRNYPGGKYWMYYTFNDGNIDHLIDTLWLASRLLPEQDYAKNALRAGRFILMSQLPDPQPAWAQQYNFEMQPVWARKFEPPAISGGESQSLINTLIDLYIESGEKAFLKPVPQALGWLEKSTLPDGRIARFYELKTNRPLYFNRKYELTYHANDLPTHYSFIVANKTVDLRKKYEKAVAMSDRQRTKEADSRHIYPERKNVTDDQVLRVVDSLDQRGAWVEEGRLSYYPKTDPTRRIISSQTFMKNAKVLADWIANQKKKS